MLSGWHDSKACLSLRVAKTEDGSHPTKAAVCEKGVPNASKSPRTQTGSSSKMEVAFCGNLSGTANKESLIAFRNAFREKNFSSEWLFLAEL